MGPESSTDSEGWQDVGATPTGSQFSEDDCKNMDAAIDSLQEAYDLLHPVSGVKVNGVSVMIESLIERLDRIMREDKNCAD